MHTEENVIFKNNKVVGDFALHSELGFRVFIGHQMRKAATKSRSSATNDAFTASNYPRINMIIYFVVFATCPSIVMRLPRHVYKCGKAKSLVINLLCKVTSLHLFQCYHNRVLEGQ
jgi:hypothetical protein